MRLFFLFPILFFISNCALTFDNAYRLDGENIYEVHVRGNSFSNSSEVKSAWFRKAEEVCQNGFSIKSKSQKETFGYARNDVMTGIIICKNKQKIISKKEQKIVQKPNEKKIFSGSGFFISKLGHILTNHHVVDSCKKVTVGKNSNEQIPANIIEIDKNNDLALLQVSNSRNFKNEKESLIQKLRIEIVPIASNGLFRLEDVKLGENVLVAGYPFGEIFSVSVKVTKGIVSSDRGYGNNLNQFQIDAAVQKGNSGGPIYDEYGNIIGIVVAQLNKIKFARNTGTMPENVNFGIKSSTIRQFLNSSGLVSRYSSKKYKITTEKLAEIAKRQSLMIICQK